MNRKRDRVILITGCISPCKDVYALKLTDSDERRKQYIESIKYYLRESGINKIVYCDNSNAQPENTLFEYAQKHKKIFEWISFVGNQERTRVQGKGYGEAEIVKYALFHSQILSDNDYMIKVTGRLIVKNLDLLSNLSRDVIRICPNSVYDGRFYVNTRVYMIPVSVYKIYFNDIEEYVNDEKGIYLEHAFGMCLKRSKLKYFKFHVAPWIEGVSGSTGRVYDPSIISYCQECIKLWIYRE